MNKTTFLPQEAVPFNIYPKLKSRREFIQFSYSPKYEMERTLSPYFICNKINIRDLTSLGRLAPSTLRRMVSTFTKELHPFFAVGQVTDCLIRFLPKYLRRNGNRAVFSKLLVILVSDKINLVRIQQAY